MLQSTTPSGISMFGTTFGWPAPTCPSATADGRRWTPRLKNLQGDGTRYINLLLTPSVVVLLFKPNIIHFLTVWPCTSGGSQEGRSSTRVRHRLRLFHDQRWRLPFRCRPEIVMGIFKIKIEHLPVSLSLAQWQSHYPFWGLLLAFGHLSHAFGISWLCFLAGWAENWAKLYMQLPISAMWH